MHACKIKRINFDELVLRKCKLKECIEWKENQQTVLAEQLVWSESSTEENTDVTISILKNAFWGENQFSKGEIIWILCKKPCEESDRNAKVIFISKENFLEDSLMLKKFLFLPEDAQKVAYAFLKGEKNEEKDEKQISNFIDPMNREDYYSIITSYLLPEQNEAYNRWRVMAHGSRGENNRRKLNYLLSISPGSPFHDHQKITYESIMKVFDDNIVGYKEVKENIARTLAEKQHLHKKRGIRILFHGLSGTGKTLWGKTIAKALDLNHKVINLASISSTVSIVGCESSYENSEPGMILKYFSECKTSETVITLDEFDKLPKPGTDRGKDGNVLESMLSLLDQEKAALRDAYIDNVPIDCSNTVCIITANRLDNIPSEVVNRCELVFEMSPYDKKTLMEIIEKQMPSVVKEYQLPEKWITQKGKDAMLLYRSDFGARDILANLQTMAAFAKSKQKTGAVTSTEVKKTLSKTMDMNRPTVRYHYNEAKYSEKQKKLILDVISRRTCRDNLSEQEKRALDIKAEYLTKLIPDSVHTFDADLFFQEAERKLYGLEESKKNIAAELYAASRGNTHSENILLIGPPGVGKSSLVEAIANATGRKYIRFQMNGINEPEFINGTSSEKVSATPGRPAKKMAEAGTSSPLMYFDEIDKITPSCELAFFDLLDDSGKFYDQFLDAEVDISEAQIVASANDISKMNPALLSRFKIIEVPGYNAKEKAIIAEQYMLPDLLEGKNINMEKEALKEIMSYYETDSGIRGLKHGLTTVIHQCMLESRKTAATIIKKEDVKRVLGRKKYIYKADEKPGCVNGLGVFGESHGIVMPIKCTPLHNGQKRVTGLPEETIRDSILIAETRLEEKHGLSIEEGYHLHFLPAFVKKSGPSAGAAIAVAMFSALTNTTVGNIAITGEFDGDNILPVGGLMNKIQAAKSAGIETVFIPATCEKEDDMKKIEEMIDIRVVYVSTMEELVQKLLPNAGKRNRKTK